MTTGALTVPESMLNCDCNGRIVSVEPEMVQGLYAVHYTIRGYRAAGPGLTITHRPSGFAVWHVREFAAAIAIAKWCDVNLVLPETLELVLEWKQNLEPTQRYELMSQLSAIAPREWVAS